MAPLAPMGATLADGGATFRVWAPSALGVSVRGSFNAWTDTPLERGPDGYWQSFVAGVREGDRYKFHVHGHGSEGVKRDPYARSLTFEPPWPFSECSVTNPSTFPWHDANFRTPAFHALVVYQYWSDNPAYFAESLISWDALETDRAMGDHLRFTRELLAVRRSLPALRADRINAFHVQNDTRILAFHRWVDGEGRDVIVVASLQEHTFHQYELGFPHAGEWREAFNSDVFEHWVNPHVRAMAAASWRTVRRDTAFSRRPASWCLPTACSCSHGPDVHVRRLRWTGVQEAARTPNGSEPGVLRGVPAPLVQAEAPGAKASGGRRVRISRHRPLRDRRPPQAVWSEGGRRSWRP